MALSGTLSKNVSSGYRLQLEWSATQDIANNRSTITTKLYWMSLGSSYTINSSATKSGRSEIGGVGEDFSGGGLASLSGNQKKLLKTYVRTVSHNSNGDLTINLKGEFAPNVTLSGSYYGNQTVSGNVTLNSIPRESSITSSLNFTAPNSFPVNISRASTSYTHTVRLLVDGTAIKAETGVQTYVNMGFTVAQMTTIFQKLNGRTSCPLVLELTTYNGSTQIGSTKSYTGTAFAEDRSTNVNSPSFNIGDTVTVAAARNNSSFTHQTKISVGGVLIHTSPVFDHTYYWNPTAAEIKAAFDTVKNANSTSSKIELITLYNGVQVESSYIQNGTAYVTNSNPTFGTGYTYVDSNATTAALTGDSSVIVQRKSTVKVTIPVAAAATPKNSATMSRYIASLDGQTISKDFSSSADVTFDFSPVSAGSNLSLSITAVDSRGNQTKTTKTVTIVPYSTPSMNAAAKRNNGFESTTKVNLKGAISALTVGGVNKNALLAASYRYKENLSTVSYPSAWTSFAVNTTDLNYTAQEQSVELDQTKQYIFQFKVTDKLGDTIIEKTVNKGKPIFFVDEKKESLGIGRFPQYANSLEMAGPLRNAGKISALNPNNEAAEVYMDFLNDQARIRVGGTGAGAVNGFQIHGTGDKVLLGLDNSQGMTTGNIKMLLASQFHTSGKYALDLNNGDIRGMNAMYSNDTADGQSEGINWLKSTGQSGSTNIADYDGIWAKDGKLFFNGTDIYNLEVKESPSFKNGWSGYFGPQYIKTYQGIVVLQGMMRNGTLGTVAFTLPPSCRPTTNQLLYIPMDNGNHCRCDIDSVTGDFKVSSVSGGNIFSSAWLDLNGIAFMTV